MTTKSAGQIWEFKRKNAELERTIVILKEAAAFFVSMPAMPVICEFIASRRQEYGVAPIYRAPGVLDVQIAPRTWPGRRLKRALGDAAITEVRLRRRRRVLPPDCRCLQGVANCPARSRTRYRKLRDAIVEIHHQVADLLGSPLAVGVFLLPVSAHLALGLTDSSTSNTGQQSQPRPTSFWKLRYRSHTATVDDHT